MNTLQFLIDIQSRDNNVTARISRLQGQIDRTESSVRRLNTAFGGLRNAFMSLSGAEFLTNPIVAITAAVGTISHLGMQAEQTNVAFTTLVGSEKEAADMLSVISDFAAKTPFSKLDLQRATQTMLNFGVNTGEVITLMKQLGDISGGNVERFNSLALVMGQVSAAGKLQGQDLLQFINAGFNPLNELAKMTGKSYQELQEQMSKGAITADMVKAAIASATGEGGKFHNMLQNLSQTTGAILSTTFGNLAETAVKAFYIIQPTVNSFFLFINDSIVPALNTVIELFSDWSGEIRIAAEVIAVITTGVAAYNGYIYITQTLLKGWSVAQWLVINGMMVWEKVQWLLNAAMTANPIGLVVAGIAALVAVVVVCWNRFAGFRAFLLTAWDTIKKFGQAIYDFIVMRFYDVIEGIGAIGKALKQMLEGDFEQAFKTATEGAKRIVGVQSQMKLAQNVANTVGNIQSTYDRNKAIEEAKDKKEEDKKSAVSAPAGSAGAYMPTNTNGSGTTSGSSSSGNTANNIISGGSKPTSITVNITKFFDSLNVQMLDRTDTAEIQRIILECINRSLETAMSSAR